MHDSVDSKLLDAGQELVRDVAVVVCHEALERLEVVEFHDQLIIPLGFAEEPAGSSTAFDLRRSIQHGIEHQVELVRVGVVLHLRSKYILRGAQCKRARNMSHLAAPHSRDHVDLHTIAAAERPPLLEHQWRARDRARCSTCCASQHPHAQAARQDAT